VGGPCQSSGCAKLARGGGLAVDGGGSGRIVSDRTAVVPPPEPVASPLPPHTARTAACHTSGPDSAARGRRPTRRLRRLQPLRSPLRRAGSSPALTLSRRGQIQGIREHVGPAPDDRRFRPYERAADQLVDGHEQPVIPPVGGRVIVVVVEPPRDLPCQRERRDRDYAGRNRLDLQVTPAQRGQVVADRPPAGACRRQPGRVRSAGRTRTAGRARSRRPRRARGRGRPGESAERRLTPPGTIGGGQGSSR
jgi:hypothetical protein